MKKQRNKTMTIETQLYHKQYANGTKHSTTCAKCITKSRTTTLLCHDSLYNNSRPPQQNGTLHPKQVLKHSVVNKRENIYGSPLPPKVIDHTTSAAWIDPTDGS
jgi:hypothetical protein